jgi:diadenosine tetraphosphate (Ap4A) HIT family hydrolase
MKCIFCKKNSEYDWLVIKRYKYWRIELRNNQNYLGWCFVVLNRHVEDLIEITPEEQRELFKVTKKLRKAITKIFQPDLYNYASLGNETRHVHLQIIPRYSNEIVFQGVTFTDENWGSNYSPYDKSFDTPVSIKKTIIQVIQAEL